MKAASPSQRGVPRPPQQQRTATAATRTSPARSPARSPAAKGASTRTLKQRLSPRKQQRGGSGGGEAAQHNHQQQQQIPLLPAHEPAAESGTESASSKASEEPPASSPAAEQPSASSSFLSQILGVSSTPPPPPQRIEMPDDVKAWLVYGGASNAAAEAEQRDDGLQTMAEGAAAAAASEWDAASVADAPVPAVVTAAKPPEPEPEAPADAAIFVHFIPPPMRENGKKDLAWIVHTCDGSGCREASHVEFNSICGFMTAEGAPPERAAGIACGCQIANHHLRGFGKVRWEKDHVAVIEHHYGGTAAVNARAYADETRKLSEQLARAREEIKKLRGMREGLTRQLDAAILAKEEKDQGVLGEMARLKHKKTSLEDKHRALAQRYEALKAELDAATKGRVGATALGALPTGDHPLGTATGSAAGSDAASTERERERDDATADDDAATQFKIGFGPWSWAVVCLPTATNRQPSSTER